MWLGFIESTMFGFDELELSASSKFQIKLNPKLVRLENCATPLFGKQPCV